MDNPDGTQATRIQTPSATPDGPATAIEQPPPTPQRSLCWDGSDGPHEIDLGDQEIVIGRSPDVSLHLDDSLVSRRHAAVAPDSGQPRLQDLESANGTFLNGERITAATALTPGDVIKVGETELTYREVMSAPPPSPELSSTRIVSAPPPDESAAAPQPAPATLYLRAGPGSPRVITWDRHQPFTIGRAEGNDLVVDDPIVSRHHAELVADGDQIFVEDLGTANGTFLNWTRIRGRQTVQPGDAVQMGGTEIEIEPALDTPSATLAIAGSGTERITIPLSGPGTVTIGRDPTGTLHLDDSQVSWHHAQIAPVFDDHVLTDLKSQNGTFINDIKVDTPVVLRPRDSIRIGQTSMLYDRELKSAPGADIAAGTASVTLRQIRPFDELDADLFGDLEPAFTPVEFHSGDTILEAPEKRTKVDTSAMYVILEGEVGVVAAVRGKWETTIELTQMGPGDYCGERAVVANHPFPHRLVAHTDVKALRLTRSAYEQCTKGKSKLTRLFRDKVVPFGVVKYLRTVPLFSQLPPAAWEDLATAMKPRSAVAREVIVRHGEACTAFLLVVSGKARANKLRDKQEGLATYLEEGKYIGEEVAADDDVYPLTVIAENAVEVLALTREQYETVRAKYATTTPGLDRASLPSSIVLHKVPPFDSLPPELITPLVDRLREKRFDTGEVIVKQGEPASAFYIIEKGSVDVHIIESSGKERSIGALKAGEYFGEQSLITERERNASIVAREPTIVLALYRSDFFDILQQGRRYGVGLEFFASLNQRDRPKQVADVEMAKHETASGQVTYILHNLQNDKYVSLSEQGLFVWNMMTGDYTLTDIAVAYSSQFHTFSMEGLFNTIAQLQQFGFLELDQTKLMRLMPDFQLSRKQRILLFLYKAGRWSIEMKHTDGMVAGVHRVVGWLIYARPILFLYALICLIGIPAFFYELLSHPKLVALTGVVLIVFVLVYGLSILLHEWGHALTVKHMHRRIIGGGFGWMYVSPYIYVNTSDMWLAGKWPRIAVTCAGPMVNLIIGSAASVLAVASSNSTVITFCIQLATINFILVLANLNPLLQLDGYYLLMDWLEIPGLRRKALGFLSRGDLKRSLRERSWNREQKIFAVFSVLILLYMLFAIAENGVMIRAFFYSSLQHLLGPLGGNIAAVVIALALSLLLILPLFREMGRARQR